MYERLMSMVPSKATAGFRSTPNALNVQYTARAVTIQTPSVWTVTEDTVLGL